MNILDNEQPLKANESEPTAPTKFIGLSIRQHRFARWCIPLVGVVIGMSAFLALQYYFANSEMAKVLPLLGFLPIAFFILLVSYIPVYCPKCFAKLKFYPSEHSAIASYTCKACGFKQ